MIGAELELVVEAVCVAGPTPARRVSWSPGAEGAPRVLACTRECVLECPAAGAIRIDWKGC